jgi:putative transposase
LLTETNDQQKARAQEIQRILGPLVALGRNLTGEELDCACRELSFCERTTREYLRRLKAFNHWTACLPEKPGPDKGTLYIKGPRLAILDCVLEEELQKTEGITEESIIKAVNDEIETARLRPLSPITIRKYLRAQAPGDLRLRRRLSGKAEQEALTPVGDGETAEWPLHKIQIDSTLADVVVVDENSKPICRPWITFVIDVFSRVVLGLYISLDAPSSVSVGSEIVDALFPRRCDGPYSTARGYP